MATNDFLPFAAAGGANVLAQADWLALAARLTGYTAGVASSQQLNKTWRQAAAVAAAFGQFINDYGGLDAFDDGNIANLVRDFTRSIQAGKFAYAVATGTANAWVVAPTPALAAYAAGRVLNIVAPATNTATTVNVNVSTLGNRRIKKSDGTDPAIGDLVSGRIYATIDDGTSICILTLLPSDILANTSIVGRTAIINVSGSFTVPAPDIEIEGYGGGGAGGASGDGTGNPVGAAGAGGGAGAYGYKRLTGLTVGSTEAVTIGAGGVGIANAAVTGGNGGTTSFGAHMTLGGGSGGPSGRNATVLGGLGGTATGADIGIDGGRGGTGGPTSTFSADFLLHIWNKGGLPAKPLATMSMFGTGVTGNGPGAGGAGASGGSAVAGGNGADGLLIVRW